MNENYRHYLIDGQKAGLRYGLNVPRNIQLGLAGGQLGSRLGSSLEFMEHREYIPGDDLRHIDWNAFARSDRLTVKLYRNEVSPHADIIIDCSRSMILTGTAKAQATLGLSAVFAQAACNRDYTYSAWQVRESCQKVLNGTEHPEIWDRIAFDYSGGCDQSFKRTGPVWRPRGIRIFLSDLLWPGEPQATLFALAQKASAVFVVQILAQADIAPPQRGNVRLVDCETNMVKNIFVDAVAQKRYRAALSGHEQNWNRACRQIGAVMTTVVAEQIVNGWKLDELVIAEILKVL